MYEYDEQELERTAHGLITQHASNLDIWFCTSPMMFCHWLITYYRGAVAPVAILPMLAMHFMSPSWDSEAWMRMLPPGLLPWVNHRQGVRGVLDTNGLYWAQYSDIYRLPDVILFDSSADLVYRMNTCSYNVLSQRIQTHAAKRSARLSTYLVWVTRVLSNIRGPEAP